MKMRLFLSALVIGLGLSIISCSSTPPSRTLAKDLKSVTAGMTADEVKAIGGEPGNIQKSGTREAWQYCKDSWAFNTWYTIWFNEGRVVTTEHETKVKGGLSPRYRTIDWNHAPDLVKDMRQ